MEEQEQEQEQEVWSWGAGTDGQLATGRQEDEWLPQFVESLSTLQISTIACGGAHALALIRGGKVVSWGRGKSGQLGHGDCESITQPKLVESLENISISSVAAGWSHSAFVSGWRTKIIKCAPANLEGFQAKRYLTSLLGRVDNDWVQSNGGELFTCGDGTFGQLGHGHFESQNFPNKVEAFASKHVSMASCGMRHTLVLLKGISGSVFAFGSARHGQLGVPATGQIHNTSNSTRKEARCFNVPLHIKEFDVHSVSFICANGEHSAALTENGHLYVWGRGFDGTLDILAPKLATATLNLCQLVLGWNHGMVLTEDGEVYMWGGAYHGKLKIKREDMIKTNSTLLGKDGDWLALQRISSLEGMKTRQIAAGAEHSAMVLENEAVMTWGWGEHGQLGLGITSDQQCPQTVPIHVQPSTKLNKSVVYCGSGFTFTLRYLT